MIKADFFDGASGQRIRERIKIEEIDAAKTDSANDCIMDLTLSCCDEPKTTAQIIWGHPVLMGITILGIDFREIKR